MKKILAIGCFTLITSVATAALPTTPINKKVKADCITLSFKPSCRETAGTISVCNSPNLWVTIVAFIAAAQETEAAACPPEFDPFEHWVW